MSDRRQISKANCQMPGQLQPMAMMDYVCAHGLDSSDGIPVISSA
jgi:hypothetical protein